MASTQTPDHHDSHRDLLWAADDPSLAPREIDAIIVPTARRPPYLDQAAELARSLRCTLVTLHSTQWTSAAKAADRLSGAVDLIAIDVANPAHLRLPRWETSRLLTGTVFARPTDLSAKRNIAMIFGRMLGWSRVLFLDDDITELNPDDVRRASGLLDTHNAVGLHVGGFPDHSVVCHAYLQAGGGQQSFIGGGALAVHLERNNSFFPDIYNEDWFFLLDGDKGIQSVGVTGAVKQYPYDPFRGPERARAEELGDVLAEGIYWLLDQNKSITDADCAHWVKFLEKRKQFIERVVRMVEQDATIGPADKERRVAALKGSLGRLARISPELCEKYLRAWRFDRQSWYRYLQKAFIRDVQQLPADERRQKALASLSRPGAPLLTWQFGTQRRSFRPISMRAPTPASMSAALPVRLDVPSPATLAARQLRIGRSLDPVGASCESMADERLVPRSPAPATSRRYLPRWPAWALRRRKTPLWGQLWPNSGSP